MPVTVEAVIDEEGRISLQKPIRLSKKRRALVVILDETPQIAAPETALLSEAALAVDWERPEEDEAWKHLQNALSS